MYQGVETTDSLNSLIFPSIKFAEFFNSFAQIDWWIKMELDFNIWADVLFIFASSLSTES